MRFPVRDTRKHAETVTSTVVGRTRFKIRLTLWRHWYGAMWSYTVDHANLVDIDPSGVPRDRYVSDLYFSRREVENEGRIKVGAIMDDIYATYRNADTAGRITL